MFQPFALLKGAKLFDATVIKKLAFLLIFAVITGTAFAQHPADSLLRQPWRALWIAMPDQPMEDFGVYHFRKNFELGAKPASFVINISADNKYKLYVNGYLVNFGPAKGDVHHWPYETIDIARWLQQGRNVIAVVVSNWGKSKPVGQLSYRTGLIVQGNTSDAEIVNTNDSWRCMRDSAYAPLVPQMIYTYYALGDNEQVDMNKYPTNWQMLGYNDRQWRRAAEITRGLPADTHDWDNSWILQPRGFPTEELVPQRMYAVRLKSVIELPDSFPAKKAVFIVPPHKKAVILLDQQELTTAFPVLEFAKGKNARITMGYAEALYINENGKDIRVQVQKGNRNVITNKHFSGDADAVISNGSDEQSYSPLFWRTFRYLQLNIETQNDSLTIKDIYSLYTGYPFKYRATFQTEDTLLKRILEVGWHTARLCAHDNYMDCPYYEQLQYVGDTRIQAMVSLYNAGDDRLMRNAINQIHYSLLPEGITLSRYPSNLQQIIPPFSLLWIGMLHDYAQYRGDKAFIVKHLMCERQIISFFAQYQQADGHLKNPPYWEFTDWSEGKGWDGGTAPAGKQGESAILDLQLLRAYQNAAELEAYSGYPELAKRYNDKAQQLETTIKASYWNPAKKLFADTYDKNIYSQHANALAILAGLVKGKEAYDLGNRLLNDSTITSATLYFRYYVNQALNKAGLGDSYLEHLDVWKANLDAGLTTWAETPDLNRTRSDCHAWGASPNIEFFRIVLGIDAADFGFNKIKIEPHLGKLKHISGSIPHPKGNIAVEYAKESTGQLKAVINLPLQTSGTFIWNHKAYPLKAGINRFTVI